jgi:hypothetical protein
MANKVRRSGGAPNSGRVSVSGPGFERERLANVHVGISAALTGATRGEVGGTWYVRDGDVTRFAVEKQDGVIQVIPMGDGADG